MRRCSGARFALAACSMLLLVGGCSSGAGGHRPATIQPATAAVSPPATTRPAGTVRPLGMPVDFLHDDSATGLLAVVGGDRTALAILDPATPATPPRTVVLGGRAAGLAAGRPGEVLVPVGHRIVRVDLRSGATTDVAVDGDASAVALRPDGDLVVGTTDGKVRIIDPKAGATQTISGLASVDGLAVTGNSVTALDRRQTSLTELDLAKKSLGLAVRAGDGATNLTTDHFGRILVTDTADNELLVFTAAPLVLRQRFPVGSSPYAVAYDEHSDTAWVALTATNEVVGFDLATGIGKQVRRYPTVRQPNALAVDSRTGDLFVGSASGAGLQTIEGGR